MADVKPDDETRKFDTLKASEAVRQGLLKLPSKQYLCKVHGVIEFAITSTIPNRLGMWCQICHMEWLDNNITKVDPVNEKPK